MKICIEVDCCLLITTVFILEPFFNFVRCGLRRFFSTIETSQVSVSIFSMNSLETVFRYNRETLQDFNHLHWRFGPGISFSIEVTIYSNLALKSRSQISPFVSNVDNTQKSFALSGGVLRLNIRFYREARRKNLEWLESNESYAENIPKG